MEVVAPRETKNTIERAAAHQTCPFSTWARTLLSDGTKRSGILYPISSWWSAWKMNLILVSWIFSPCAVAQTSRATLQHGYAGMPVLDMALVLLNSIDGSSRECTFPSFIFFLEGGGSALESPIRHLETTRAIHQQSH